MTQPPRGILPATYVLHQSGESKIIEDGVIEEEQVCIFVNGKEIATLMCSPIALPDLAIGFLRAEGFIRDMSAIRSLRLSENGACVDVWLHHAIHVPSRHVISAGCGADVTFDDLVAQREPLRSAVQIQPQQITALMKTMQQRAELYREAGGVHTAALCISDEVLLVAQDISRHNGVLRLWGMALQQTIDTRDKIIVTSGRISSEMLSKAMLMQAPIVISRTSPTSLSVALAHAWNVTLIGYCRGNQFRAYTARDRILA